MHHHEDEFHFSDCEQMDSRVLPGTSNSWKVRLAIACTIWSKQLAASTEAKSVGVCSVG